MRITHLIQVFVCFLILVGCKAASSTAQNDTVSYEPGDVRISAPLGWKTTRVANQQILTSPNADVTMIFFAPAERGMEAGMAEVDRIIKRRKGTGVDMRGTPIADKMTIQNYFGTGDADKGQVLWMLTLVDKDTFEEPRLAVLTFGAQHAFQSNVDNCKKVISGLTRIK